jgi:hypothetical protein
MAAKLCTASNSAFQWTNPRHRFEQRQSSRAAGSPLNARSLGALWLRVVHEGVRHCMHRGECSRSFGFSVFADQLTGGYLLVSLLQLSALGSITVAAFVPNTAFQWTNPRPCFQQRKSSRTAGPPLNACR